MILFDPVGRAFRALYFHSALPQAEASLVETDHETRKRRETGREREEECVLCLVTAGRNRYCPFLKVFPERRWSGVNV
jgi:hypothetical protein